MYGQIKKVHEQEDDKYMGRASLWIGAKVPPDADYEFDYERKIEIPFRVSFEHRTWGINGFNVSLSDTIKVEARKVFYDDKGDEAKEEPVTLDVDLSQLKIDWVEGGIIGPGELSLNLNTDGTVDYTKSTIEFYYIKPE